MSEIRHPRLTVTPSPTHEHSPPRRRLEKTQQTCRHCCGKCCSSPEQSGIPAPGHKRRRSAWPRPSRPVEKEPGEECSRGHCMLQIFVLQQLSAGLVRELDGDCGSMGLATQPTGVLGRVSTLSLGPWVPTMLAADPSSKEMFGPVSGSVTAATLKPVAVLLPTGLNKSEEQTFFCTFQNISLQGEVGLRDGGGGREESNRGVWCNPVSPLGW